VAVQACVTACDLPPRERNPILISYHRSKAGWLSQKKSLLLNDQDAVIFVRWVQMLEDCFPSASAVPKSPIWSRATWGELNSCSESAQCLLKVKSLSDKLSSTLPNCFCLMFLWHEPLDFSLGSSPGQDWRIPLTCRFVLVAVSLCCPQQKLLPSGHVPKHHSSPQQRAQPGGLWVQGRGALGPGQPHGECAEGPRARLALRVSWSVPSPLCTVALSFYRLMRAISGALCGLSLKASVLSCWGKKGCCIY